MGWPVDHILSAIRLVRPDLAGCRTRSIRIDDELAEELKIFITTNGCTPAIMSMLGISKTKLHQLSNRDPSILGMIRFNSRTHVYALAPINQLFARAGEAPVRMRTGADEIGIMTSRSKTADWVDVVKELLEGKLLPSATLQGKRGLHAILVKRSDLAVIIEPVHDAGTMTVADAASMLHVSKQAICKLNRLGLIDYEVRHPATRKDRPRKRHPF